MELKGIFESFFSKGGKVIQRKNMPDFTLAKLRLASHPEAKPSTLKKLSRHECESIVARVAENGNATIDILEDLAIHPQSEVRIAVAENVNTPPRILFMLASDSDADVRYSLAENHNVPLAVLSLLCEDDNPYVADRANKTLTRLHLSKNRNNAWFPYFGVNERQRGIS